MRAVLCLLVTVATLGCGSETVGSGETRYGISIEAGEGWDVSISRGLVRVARGEVSVEIYEYEARNAVEATHFDGAWPVRLQAREFGRRDDEQERLVTASGRLFTVFAYGRPTRDELAEINAMLKTIDVTPGDFFPGAVEPASFSRRAGWNVGASAPGKRQPQGEFVTAWASTSDYRDGPHAFPRETLEALPVDGIVVWVMLSRGGRETWDGARVDPPPYRLEELDGRDFWEGQIRDLPEYVLWTTYGDGYLVDLRVYFGRPRPTPQMLVEADAMLSGLTFPDWGPWERDAA